MAAEDLTALAFEDPLQRDYVSASRLARQVSDSPPAVAIVTADDNPFDQAYIDESGLLMNPGCESRWACRH